jgi:hypothetical protein
MGPPAKILSGANTDALTMVAGLLIGSLNAVNW